jgi:hypothetical protein
MREITQLADHLLILSKQAQLMRTEASGMGPRFWNPVSRETSWAGFDRLSKRYGAWESETESYIREQLGDFRADLFRRSDGLPVSDPPFDVPATPPFGGVQMAAGLWKALDVRIKRLDSYISDVTHKR